MQDFPHRYTAAATAASEGNVTLASPQLEPLPSAAPAEFGGPGNLWSPETLLVAAAADCFVLGFRAIARASRLPWISLDCRAEGVLERVERVTRFTAIHLQVALAIPPGGDAEAARRALERAESTCLINNSLTATRHLDATVTVAEA